MKTFLLTIGILAGFTSFAPAQDAQAIGETDSVRRTVEAYISIKDPEQKRNVVDRDARIISVDGQGRRVESLISKRAKHRADAVVVLPEQAITSIDMTDGAALVKVESIFVSDTDTSVSLRKHFQYISLLKLNGDWKIVSILMPPLRLDQVASK